MNGILAALGERFPVWTAPGGRAVVANGDALAVLAAMPAGSVQCCVTSPPYWGLRDYGAAGQIGLEQTPDEYVSALVAVFREVRRVLRDDGTCWVNLGDSYANGGPSGPQGKTGDRATRTFTAEGLGSGRNGLPAGLKPKDLVGIPWRVAFALQSDGWYLRQDIIWHKPNPMPESVTDRCTKAHEYIFLLAKAARYYYDGEAIKEEAADNRGTVRFSSRRAEGGMGIRATGNEGRDAGKQDQRGDTRNRRSVWTVASQPYAGAHFATFPPKLIEPCILAGCPAGGVVLDPFAGSGTTVLTCEQAGRTARVVEVSLGYCAVCLQRWADATDIAPVVVSG